MNRVTPLILAVALFMEMMDSTVIATSLPAIAADIGTDPISLKLALTSYFVALAIFIPVSGWLADRFGAINVFRLAILVFMTGSVLCALSGSLGSFVGSRFLQGMGGAMMSPLARLVLVRATPKKDLVNAMAWLSIPALVGPMMGPPIGGFITTYFSWHWIFIVNVPIGIIGIIAATLFLPRVESERPPPLDWRGFLLAGTCFSGMLFGLSVVSMPALPIWVGVASLATGTAAGGFYFLHVLRTPAPLLDPAMFRYPNFRTAIVAAALFRTSLGALPFLLPLTLQLAFGLTPFESGMVLLYVAVGALGAKFIARRVYAWFGFRTTMLPLVVAGSLLMGLIGFITPEMPGWWLAVIMLMTGLTRSVFFTGCNALNFSDVPGEKVGQATAIFAVTTQLSIALGVALAGGILDVLSSGHGDKLLLGDFHAAFIAVAAVSLLTVIPLLRLPRDAGSAVSGHHKRLSDDKAIIDGK